MSSKIGDPNRTLSDSINVATRSVHTKLNKLVVSRLPLAQPPQADDASQYVSGLLHIAPIYITFESLWRTILKMPESLETHNSEQDGPTDTSCGPDEVRPEDRPSAHRQLTIDTRIETLLTNLYFDGLQRSSPLQQDLMSLTCWSDRTLSEQLKNASKSPVLAEFLAHIETSVGKSPHVLLAYAWVLYMALFSGGRFIRASLENIYPAFWIPASAQQHTSATLGGFPKEHLLPLSFFRFNTHEDGEDLKQDFKKRLLESETFLTNPERDEIVEEARRIFEYMIRIIGELDDICGTDKEAAEARLLSLRSRDSLVVQRERREQIKQKTTAETAAERTRNWVEKALQRLT
ncbi:hypothetical protein F5B22DRAFT_240861 [Xylaria bambusicola]|uniref:uncharacterized protein n=1 Tax=Xylaria bambusicola TaxID=326684 RepID=UPI0020077D58|nr:uncharacterized protein F5B22DRAFT_240861 [Xylaria bambusicola]KAI0514427.1 hypothetical protein F5B22DRAFT_240861 [Xylaria bambusicola]